METLELREVELDIPRVRTGTFEPQIIKKGQTRLSVLDDQILALYAKGMSTRDIIATLRRRCFSSSSF